MQGMSYRSSKYTKMQIVFLLLLFMLVAMLAQQNLGNDFSRFIKWWGMLFIIGIAFYPLSAGVFIRFDDKGYLFAKGIGIAISGWIMWLASSFRLLPFSEWNSRIILAACAGVNYVILIIVLIVKKHRKKKKESVKPYRPADDEEEEQSVLPRFVRVLWLELLFFALFAFFMYLKGFRPEAYGTEKMMDYGFISSMYRTDYFPVDDFWFHGEPLNYYYFGQYLMTFLTKLSADTVSYGYNFGLGIGFAICLSYSYALICQIVGVHARRKEKRAFIAPHVGGALAALAVGIAGNGHYIVFSKLVPAIWDILQIPGDKPSYWFPNSTRYIGYIPDKADKTIHEFPSYSFILGDLHAHVINITFVLIVVAALFSFLMCRQAQMKRTVESGTVQKLAWKKEIFDSRVLLIGFFIGIFMMTNYWDFPIYFVVAGAVILVSNAVIAGFRKETLILTALHAIIVIVLSQIVALPFNMNFVAMANGIALTEMHTAFYQLVILWGLPILAVIAFVISQIAEEYRLSRNLLRDEDDEGNWRKNPFFKFLENRNIEDLFILILGLCAIGLILAPEVVYIVDIYGGSYKRSNTMFKLTYQAYILFGLVMGYIITRFVLFMESKKQLVGGLIIGVFMIWTCGYFGTSCKAWFGDTSKSDNFKGIRADRYIYTERPGDAAAIDWIMDHVSDGSVILEANGDSYTIYNRVSTLTGLSTVLGWHTHEWLWHNSVTMVDYRANDITTIYTYRDEELVHGLLRDYDVDYIFVGSCEYEKYLPLGMDVEFLKTLGEVVYQGYPDESGQVVYIIRVGG